MDKSRLWENINNLLAQIRASMSGQFWGFLEFAKNLCGPVEIFVNESKYGLLFFTGHSQFSIVDFDSKSLTQGE